MKSIAGSENLFADLLSRWGVGKSFCGKVRRTRSRRRVSSSLNLEDVRVFGMDYLEKSSWPTETEIRAAQDDKLSEDERLSCYHDDADNLWKRKESGGIAIPQACEVLRKRLLIIAHCGSSGHRAQESTMNTLCDKFHWESMAEDVSTFCHQCLHCVPTRGGRMVPRPLGDTLVGARGNHVLQVDFFCLWSQSRGKIIHKSTFWY